MLLHILTYNCREPHRFNESAVNTTESGTHVPLFKDIFKTTVRKVGLNLATECKALDLIRYMTDEEKIWTKHITAKLLGFSDQAIDMFIEEKANSVCRNLNLPLQYNETNGGPLMSIVERYSMLSSTKTKSNFFEVPVGDYAINSLDEDY